MKGLNMYTYASTVVNFLYDVHCYIPTLGQRQCTLLKMKLCVIIYVCGSNVYLSVHYLSHNGVCMCGEVCLLTH